MLTKHILGPLALALAMGGLTVSAAPISGDKITWKKTVLDTEFRSEGVAVADVNRDGKLDIMAGSFWYEAPNWTPHELRPVEKFDAAKGYSTSFLQYSMDVNRDGWADLIVIGFPGAKATWYENPKGKAGHWAEREVFRSACNETPAFEDVNGDGKPELVFPYDESVMAWYEPDADPTKPFIAHPISEPNAPGVKRFSHGMGVGDVNGDGRADILVKEGYWVAPQDRKSGPWKFVPANFGADCANIRVYDVNGDGLNDVITSSAHNIGVWWHEQVKTETGTTFRQHTIDDTFSQSHALILADINGDGVKDIITGKRWWAHGPTGDVQPNEPAVLYWYELKRESSGPRFIRHTIDTDSGVGTQFQVIDMNRNGLLDVVVSNKKGVFLFEQQRPRK